MTSALHISRSAAVMTRQPSGPRTHQAHNLCRGRGTRHAGPASHDVRDIEGRIDKERRRQGFCQHTRRGHDTNLSHTCMSGVSRARVDDVVVQQTPTQPACFTRCFTHATIRHSPSSTLSSMLSRTLSRAPCHRIRANPAQRPQVIPGRRQRRHAARRQLHDTSDRRGPAMWVAQARAPRGTVGASPEHRHRRGPHRHEDAARPHSHRQVAARVGAVSLRDPTQVEARAGRIHTTHGLTREPHRPPSFADARQQAPRRRTQRRLDNMPTRRGRQRRTRDVRGPHRLDIPGGNKRPDQRVEHSPGRLRERQRVAQQPIGFFVHDEAGAALCGIGPATGCTGTAPSRGDSIIEPRHLRRRPEHAPHVLVARDNAHDSVDDRHAVTAPADDVDAGAHRGEGGAPRGRVPRGPGHGLVPRGAGEARGLSRRSLRGPCRGRRPWSRRSGRGC